MEIKQSSTKPIVFKMVDDTDLRTPETGLSPTVTISKNGAAFAAPAGTVGEVGNGFYKLTPTSADTNTLGPLILDATATGAYCPGMLVDVVSKVEADTYALVDTMASQFIVDSVDTGFDETTTTFKGGGTASLEGTANLYVGRSILWTSGVCADQIVKITGYTGSAGYQFTVEPMVLSPSDGDTFIILPAVQSGVTQTGDAYARLGAPTGASIAADISTVDTVVDGIAGDLTNGFANVFAQEAAVASMLETIDTVVDAIKEVTDLLPNSGALSDLATLASRLSAARAGYLDKLNVSGTLAHSDAAATYKADVSSLVDIQTDLTEVLADTDTLEQLLTPARAALLDKLNVSGTLAHSDAATTYQADAATIAAAVIAFDLSGATPSAGSFGSYIKNFLDAAISSRSSHSAGDVVDLMENPDLEQIAAAIWTYTTRAVTNTSVIAAAVWAYVTRTLTSAGAGGATAAEVWEYATRTLTSGGAGGATAEEIRVEMDANSTQLAAIKAKTDLISPGSITISSPVAAEGNKITARAGDSWGIPMSNLGDLSGRADLVFVVQPFGSDDDDGALVLVSETEGLLRLKRSAAETPGDGGIVVSAEAPGALVVVLADEASVTLKEAAEATWALKVLKADGTSETLANGEFVIAKALIRRTAD